MIFQVANEVSSFILPKGQRVNIATSGPPNFRGLTGGVYKAQEHIHRSMLTDLRLLAIPASCRRISACNPSHLFKFNMKFPADRLGRICQRLQRNSAVVGV